MAVFNLDAVGSLDTANDIKQVKSYLYKLQEQLRYMFANLDPDDNNAASVPKLTYAKDENGEAIIEVTTDGVTVKMISSKDVDEKIESAVEILEGQINLRVKTSDLGNSSLTIKPAKIELATTGQLVISAGNLTIDSNGNAKFKGNITASSINGSTITGSTISGTSSINCGSTFQVVDETGHGYEAYLGFFSMQWDAGYNDNTLQSNSGRIVLGNSSGVIRCRDLKFTNQSWDPDEWPLSEWLDWLYDHVS